MNYRLCFHFIGAVYFWFGFYYTWNYVKLPLSLSKNAQLVEENGHLMFLTIWNVILLSIFFTISIVNDIIGTNEKAPVKSPLIRRIKDTIFASLTLPCAVLVTVLFWTLYFIDRKLIFPEILEQHIPSWLNHLLHTNISLFIFVELCTSCKKYPSRKRGLMIFIIFTLSYLCWIHIIYFYTKFWVYPILQVLNLPLRIVFFLLVVGVAASFYLLGEKLNDIIWKEKWEHRKQK